MIINIFVEVAQTFNEYFQITVYLLDTTENKYLLTKINNELSGVNEAISKFEHHPSVLSIKGKGHHK